MEQGDGATVALLPQTFPSNGGGDLIRLATAGPDGAFEIAGVPPGSYYALALERGSRAPQPEQLRTLLSTATSIQVEESATTNVERVAQ